MAVTTFTGQYTPNYGVTVTAVTDSSADWASVSNSTYFYDIADGLTHYKNADALIFDTSENGGSIKAINTYTGATVTANADDYTIKCDCTSNTVTVDLPAAASSVGRVYYVVKIDAVANDVIIDASGAELINGATTLNLTTQWDSVQIQCVGTYWTIIG